MRQFIVSTLVGTVLFCCVFVTAADAQTSQPFSTELTTTYDVRQEPTRVTHHIVVTNTQPTQYLARYGISVSSPDIRQVRVTSNDQVIQPEVVTSNGLTTIGISFPDQVVGEGQARTIDISYLHPDAAIASGKVLEVSVPKVDGAENYAQYTVVLLTPSSYGLPTRITPTKYTSVTDKGALITTLPITNGQGVTALFGSEQLFQINIEYDLRNPSQNTSLAQITLPPDTNRQTMYYQQLTPQPLELQTDPDGNWIATYQLPAQSDLTITAKAIAHLTLDSQRLPTQKAPSQQLTTEQPFWDLSHTQIQHTASSLTNIRAIYDFVVDTLEYDYSQQEVDVPRLTASQALSETDRATCEEFTDVFVTLARAKNIPARRITGYAYTRNQTLRPLATQNSDILHAWPEYFDQAAQEWFPVDPTWEKTTGGVNYFDLFDLNHITLAIQGHSSTLPYPAGASFNDGPERKLIEVNFANQLPDIRPNWQTELTPLRIASIPIPGRYQLRITNPTGKAWYTVSVAAQYSNAAAPTKLANLEVILPYQSITIAANATSTSLMPQSDTLELEINHDDQTEPYTASYSVTSIAPATEVGITVVAVGGCILVVSLLSRGLLVRRRRR